jgi:threonyl-tRNA synthetase
MAIEQSDHEARYAVPEGERESAIAVRADGKLVDLSAAIPKGAAVEVIRAASPEGRQIQRHSAAHVLAQAVQQLYPGTWLAIGPATEEGFYYDMDVPTTLKPEDLQHIEERMQQIKDDALVVRREELSRQAAIELFESMGESYKVELLRDLPEERVSIYRQNGFVDLCRGPHVPDTARIGAFKLLSIAGAYFRGDEKRPMLQRVYGTTFATEGELTEYLTMREEAEKRDHRRLGRELDLFSFHEEAGAGVVFYHPKGAILRGLIEDFLKEEHRKRGYQMVITPHLMKDELWKISGHLDYYTDNMYLLEKEGTGYVVKPMNCPGHMLIYKTQPRSYRDMPLKYFELGTVYRYERSGVLHGLLRVRGFTQDDAHIFCTNEQLEGQIIEALDFAVFSLRSFGFEQFKLYLSTRPEHSVGSDENWERATKALADALTHHGMEYEIDPGEGVFYGPKIDVKLKDAIGRYWQGPTIQVDFNMPERFDITYAGSDNRPHRPVMIHRVVLAGIERFLGVLIEHYGGALPVWLSPVQAVIVPVADRHQDHAEGLAERLRVEGGRVEVDGEHQTVNMKIRRAQVQKVPFTLVVGDREMEQDTVAVRLRTGEDLRGLSFEEFAAGLRRLVETRSTGLEWR